MIFGQWPIFGHSGVPKVLLSDQIPTRPGLQEGVMNRHGFPAARPIFPTAGFRGLSILTLVTLVIAWAPRCEAGSEIRPGSGLAYTVFATGLAGPRGLLFSPSGDLFAVEQSGGTIVRITPDGRVSRFAKGFSAPPMILRSTLQGICMWPTRAPTVLRGFHRMDR